MDTTHLFTTVRNPLGHARTYGYLGYHGRTLAAGAHYTWFGNLDRLFGVSKQRTDALQRDLLAGKLEIISTPRPIFRDATTYDIKALNLNSGALGAIDPSWGAYNDS